MENNHEEQFKQDTSLSYHGRGAMACGKTLQGDLLCRILPICVPVTGQEVLYSRWLIFQCRTTGKEISVFMRQQKDIAMSYTAGRSVREMKQVVHAALSVRDGKA